MSAIIEDRLLRACQRAGSDGLTRTQLRHQWGSREPRPKKQELDAALAALVARGQIKAEECPTAGRHAVVFRALD